MWWKRHKTAVLFAGFLLAALIAAFLQGGRPASSGAAIPAASVIESDRTLEEPTEEEPAGESVTKETAERPAETPPRPEKDPANEKEDDPRTEQAGSPEDLPPASLSGSLPAVEESEASKENTCTVSISCATILENLDRCPPEKAELLPEDGWVLPPTAVSYTEGGSVFQVLQQTCRQYQIHMEYTDTPGYGSAYIEGIHNLYEFDLGDLSGWMYSVNGQFPNYGCSQYLLQDGDTVCWVYTCDFGADVGGSNFSE